MGNGKLRSLFCSIPSLGMEIIQPLSNLFLMKTFYRLHLEIDDFCPQAITKLLQAFMTTRCNLAQKLIIRTSESARQSPFLTKQQLASLDMGPVTISECALHHKTLQIYPQNYILQFLLLLPCIRLTDLELNCSSGTTSNFHFCASHPNLQVKKLTLNLSKQDSADENKLIKATIENDLRLLISNPALRELHISGNWGGFPEAKQGLLQGLQQQRQPNLTCKLRNLNLDMAGYSEKDVQSLLEATVSPSKHYRPRIITYNTFFEAAKSEGMTYDKIHSIVSGRFERVMTKQEYGQL